MEKRRIVKRKLKPLRKEIHISSDITASKPGLAAYFMIVLLFGILAGALLGVEENSASGFAMIDAVTAMNYTLPAEPSNETSEPVEDIVNETLADETNSTAKEPATNETVESPVNETNATIETPLNETAPANEANATIVDETNTTANETAATPTNETIPVNRTIETQINETILINETITAPLNETSPINETVPINKTMPEANMTVMAEPVVNETQYTAMETVCDYNLSACKTSGWVSGKTYCLNQSVSTSSNCMRITADNVTIDCKGYNITGPGNYKTDYGTGIGVNIYSLKNATVKNCRISGFTGYGLYISGSSNTTVQNTTIENNRYYGIYCTESYQGIYTGNTIKNNTGGGWTHSNCRDSLIKNNSILNNTGYGISIGSNVNGRNNIVVDNIIQENSQADLFVSTQLDQDCNQIIQNNTGSGNRPILFYNSSVVVENTNNVSLLELCNADHSIVRNVTISGSDTLKNNGLYIAKTDYTNVSYVNSSHNYDGVYLRLASTQVVITNSTFNNNAYCGVELSAGLNTVKDCEIKENAAYDFLNGGTCTNDVKNNVGSGGRKILYLNNTVANLQNDHNISLLILCQASNSKIVNVTVRGSDTYQNNWIWVGTSNNINFTNVNSSGNNNGFYFQSSNSNIIYNSTITGNRYGIQDSSSTTGQIIKKSEISGNTYGIVNFFAGGPTVIENRLDSNNLSLQFFYMPSVITFTNNTVNNSAWDDLFVYVQSTSQCNNFRHSGNSWSGDKPLLWYNNTAANIKNTDNFSTIVLCNADNSVIENITMKGAGNNRIWLEYTDSSNLTKMNISSTYYGVYMLNSNNNLVKDSIFSGIAYEQIYISGNGNEAINNTMSGSTRGIHISGQSNYVLNNTINTSERGITIGNSISYTSNIISGNTIEGASKGGIIFQYYLFDSSNYNTIYNNYLDNEINAFDIASNYWNTTYSCSAGSGQNIIGGDCIGGNYWSDYAGTDTGGDGIGDTILPYNAGGSIQTGGDYLPLTEKQCDYYINSCKNSGWESGKVYCMNASVETTSTCMDITNNSVILDCMGYNLTGNWTSTTYGIKITAYNETVVKNCKVFNFTYGIYINSAYRTSILNCTLSNNKEYGLYNSGYVSKIRDNIINNNSYTGIYTRYSHSIITNNQLNNNSYGMQISNALNYTVTGNRIQNSRSTDLIISATAISYCNNIIENNTASENKRILYYNTSVNLENENNLSNLILCNADNSRVHNVTIGTNSLYNGRMEAILVDNSNFTSINASGNYYGLLINKGSNNRVAGLTAVNNKRGLAVFESSGNLITNNTMIESLDYDLDYSETSVSHCNNIIQNNTGSGGRPILFYNKTINLENTKNISELVLCNANNSRIDNITVRGSENINNNGIKLLRTSYTNFTRVTSSNNSEGILIYANCKYNRIINCTINNNKFSGIFISVFSISNIINKNSISGNTNGIGLLAYGDNNIISNNIIDNNSNAGISSIVFAPGPSGTRVTNNTIRNNGVGISFSVGSNNMVYNNYFNNTINANDPNTNYWNTTYSCSPGSGQNIIGGDCIGGNYWGDYAGTDTGGDGIGDTILPYTSNGFIINGGDYYPLAGNNPPNAPSLKANSTTKSNYTNESITCWANATDINSDNVSYSGYWLKDGKPAFWNRTFGRGVDDSGQDVAIDSNNNIIIVGFNGSSSAKDNDIWVVKYSSSGTLLWNTTLKGSQKDRGFGIAVDASGNIIIAGETNSTGSGKYDFWTIKLNSTGGHIWNSTFGGSQNDEAFSAVTDSNDNIIVSGRTSSFGAGGLDCLIVKYGKNGNYLWNRTFGTSGDEDCQSIALDSNENIIIAGYNGTDPYDYLTVKLNSTGGHIWNRSQDRTGGWDFSYDVAVDDDNNILITGESENASEFTFDAWTIKYDKNGNELWNVAYGENDDDQGGYGISIDLNGNIVVTGVNSNGYSNYQLLTLKYDLNGNKIWESQIGGSDDDWGQDIAVDSRNNIIISGITKSYGANPGTWDMFIVKNPHLIIYPTGNFTEGELVNVSKVYNYDTYSGDNWSCYIRAYDGEDYSGYSASNNVTVQEIPPGAWIGAHNYIDGGLVAEWRFEYGNSTWAYDEKEANYGTVIGATHVDSGRVGKAYEFDGVSKHIIISNESDVVNPGTGITVSAWVNAKSLHEGVTDRRIVSCTESNGYSMGVVGGNIMRFRIRVGASYYTATTPAVKKNEWYHVVGVYNNSKVMIYINGVKYTGNSITGSILASNQPLCIGSEANGGACTTSFWNGTIDEVAIWNRSLEDYEIAKLYATSKGNYALPEQDIACAPANTIAENSKSIYNWKVDGRNYALVIMPFESNNSAGAGKTRDYSGNGYNGTVSGARWFASGGFDGRGYINFTGATDKVTLPKSLGVAKLNFTIAHWVRLTDKQNRQIYTIGNTGGISGYRFGISYEKIGFLIGNATRYTEEICGTTKIADGNWHHIAGVFKRGDKIECYVDGEYDGSSGIAAYPNMYDGAPTYGDPPCCVDLDGGMDDVYIFNKSLSADEIKNIYRFGLAGIAADQTEEGEEWECSVTLNNGTYDYKAKNTTGMLIRSECDYYLSSCKNSGWAEGSTYCLTEDIKAPGSCMKMTADNVKLDCKGFNITGKRNGAGINSTGYSSTEVENCAIYNFTTGIYFKNSADSGIYSTTSTGNSQYGAYIDSSSGVNISSGNFSSNLNSGIRLVSTTSSFIGENYAESNSIYGIWLATSSTGNTLYKNTVKSNSLYGLSIASGCTGNKIYNNYFSNTDNVFAVSGNYWNTTLNCNDISSIIGSPCIGGNYWSNYAGADNDEDGIGDTSVPYTNGGSIAGGGDYLPLVAAECNYFLYGCKDESWNAGKRYCLKQNVSTTEETCMKPAANNIVLDCKSHKMQGNDIFTSTYYGIFILGNDNITIKSCEVSGFYNGVYVSQGQQNKIIGNILRNNSNGIATYKSASNNFSSNLIESNRYTALSNGQDGHYNIFVNNTITNCGSGYSSFSTTGVEIRDNRIYGTRGDGILVYMAGNNIITGNDVQNSTSRDILFFPSVVANCHNNLITNNTGSGGMPILFYNKTINLENTNNISELILCDADNSRINNITVQGSEELKNNGIFAFYVSNSNFTNINSSHNYYGIYMDTVTNSRVTNITADEGLYGIYTASSSGNTIANNSLRENLNYDLSLSASSASYCKNVIENNTGSGGRSILYYNKTINMENQKDIAELIVCNGPNSRIKNATIRGSDTLQNNGLFLFHSSGSNITNSNSSHNLYGVYLYGSPTSVRVINNTMKNISGYGVYIFQGSGNYIVGNEISGNGSSTGLYSYFSNSNNIIGNSVSNSLRGLYIYYSSSSIISNNTIAGNANGTWIYYNSNNNKLYNNYFDNTNNVYEYLSSNKWNTTYSCSLGSGQNIVGGDCIGGNYWNDYAGTDNTNDGIGDTNIPYTSNGGISSGGDYLPLVNISAPGAGIGWSKLIPPEGVFEPYNAALSGTHVNKFSIKFINLTINPANELACSVRMANGTIKKISATGLSLSLANYSLNYTVQSSDSIINHATVGYIPWVLKNCTITYGASLVYNETKTSRIYTHNPEYWEDDEVTRAVACAGSPGKYFNNSAKCEFNEDTLFALQMRNGNPVEQSCFNNPGAMCSSDYCKGIYFPTCDPLDYFGGFSAESDDPNGYTTFSVSFASYSTAIAYTKYTNTSGNFRLRLTQALSGKTFSITIYNLTNVSSANTYGAQTGGGTTEVVDNGDGTYNIAHNRLGTGNEFTGTLDFTFNVSFDRIVNKNRTLKIVLAYGADNNQGTPTYFTAEFSPSYGLRNRNESETSPKTTDTGGVCGDEANNDFDYISGTWANSYDCFDPDCSGIQGDNSQTNEFGSAKTGICTYAAEANCTDEFDNDYDYIAGSGYTDCHDSDCFHIDSACPSQETICEDSINNDWDYTLGESDQSSSQKIDNNGTKYTSTYSSGLTDCEDIDCNGLVGGSSGQKCNWGYELNCSDSFDNDALQLTDCQLGTVASSTSMPTAAEAEYDCAAYCRINNTATETGSMCNDNKDNDWDAVRLTGYYSNQYASNTTYGAGIDCRWGGYFGYGSNYNPDENCNMTILSNSYRCELAKEINCTDGFDNDYDHDASGMPSAGWSANTAGYLSYFGKAYSTDADFDDYDCKRHASAPSSEAATAAWCFDGIDNDLDRYFWNSTLNAWQLNSSTGIDCEDPSCLGVTNPANQNQTCLTEEYNPLNSFFTNLPFPGLYCSNSLDDDADGPIDCADTDCFKQFSYCSQGPCYQFENITWNSCADSSNNDYADGTDCADHTDCDGMLGSASGALCLATEQVCYDSFDNNAGGGTDCADSGCANQIGGKINGTALYCRSSETGASNCFDGFDNDAAGGIDCYDSSCLSACGLSSISGTAPISLPQKVGQTAINSVTTAYVLARTSKVRNTEWYNITFRMTAASTNAQWTIGTATGGKFNKTAFNASTAYLSGANAASFALSETANGFVLDSSHASLPSGYTVSFLIKAKAVMPSRNYELTYAEESGSQTSLNNYIAHEVDENIAPQAQLIRVVPNSTMLKYGGTVYLRANISDNNQLGLCDWQVYGAASFNPADSTTCRGSFSPTVEGVYNINVTPVDYYSNRGTPITKQYSLNIIPTGASISTGSRFYSNASSMSVTASFNVPAGDTLGTCQVIARMVRNNTDKPYKGTETALASFAASGTSCTSSSVSISSLKEGIYEIYVKATETTDNNIAESGTESIFVCNNVTKGVCTFADFNSNSRPDSCANDTVVQEEEPPAGGGGGGGGGGTVPPTCSDECASGQKRCVGNGVESCGNYDSDACLEWGGSIQDCGLGKECVGGTCVSCNDCPSEGSLQCSGKNVQECVYTGNCLGWMTLEECADSCSGGECTCADECAQDECSGNSIISCIDIDDDGCTELDTSNPDPCAADEVCSEGSCVFVEAPEEIIGELPPEEGEEIVQQIAQKVSESPKEIGRPPSGGGCMGILERQSETSLEVEEVPITEALQIPPGFEIIKKPFKIDCLGDSFILTLNIPSNYVDIKALRCRQGECQREIYTTLEREFSCGIEVSAQITEEERYILPQELELIPTEEKIILETDRIITAGRNSVEFISPIPESLLARLGGPKADVAKPSNPSLSIIGSPLVVKLTANAASLKAKVTMPYTISQGIDEESIGIYSYEPATGGWALIESAINLEDKSVTANVDEIIGLINARNEAMFAVIGIKDPYSEASVLEKVYSYEGSRDAIMLVHGLGSSPETFDGMINEFMFNKQPWQIWTFGYSSSKDIDEIATDLQEAIESHNMEFDHLYLVGHSLGAMVVQQALHNADLNRGKYPFVEKARKVILIGAPNEGSPSAAVYQSLYKYLVNLRGKGGIFNVNSDVLKELAEGRIIPRVKGIDYYVIAGTRPYEFNVGLFSVKAGELFDVEEKNDGIVDVQSAQNIGGDYVNDMCRNYWEINVTHTDIIDVEPSVKVIEKVLSEGIAETHKEMALLGFNQYFKLRVDSCNPEDTYVLIGRKIKEEEAYDELKCACGNGYCGEGEDELSCPSDCARILTAEMILVSGPLIIYSMLIATFAISLFYVTAKYLFSIMLGMGWVNTVVTFAALSAAATGIYSISYGVHLWIAYISEAFIIIYTTLLEIWAHKSGYHRAVMIRHHARNIAKSGKHLSRFNRELEKIELFAEKPILKAEKELKAFEKYAEKPILKAEEELKAFEKYAKKPILKAEAEAKAIALPLIKAEEEVKGLIFHKGMPHKRRSSEVSKIIQRIMEKERHRKIFEKVPYKSVEELHKSMITRKSKKKMDANLGHIKKKIDKLRRMRI